MQRIYQLCADTKVVDVKKPTMGGTKNKTHHDDTSPSKLRTYVKYITMSESGAVPPLTTHILDTARGLPAARVSMVLYKQNSAVDSWTQLQAQTTNTDGRGGFLKDQNWQPGVYKLHFDTDQYFKRINVVGFYPYVEVVFRIDDPSQHYHVPLLLSPYGYSTYRGS